MTFEAFILALVRWSLIYPNRLVFKDVTSRLNHLDSRCEELDAVERLRVLHDFYRTGEETEYHLDLRECMRKGRSFKDAICPDSMEFKKDHFAMGGKYGRVLFLKEYASYIKDCPHGHRHHQDIPDGFRKRTTTVLCSIINQLDSSSCEYFVCHSA